MPVSVKICGLTEPETLHAAVSGGARYVGFVFYPPSPRSIAPSMAAELARLVADYIAGMTDRYALAEYARLFDMDAKT